VSSKLYRFLFFVRFLIFSFFMVPRSRLSWLAISLLAQVNTTYRIVSYSHQLLSTDQSISAACLGWFHQVIAPPLTSTSGGSGMERSSPGRAGSVWRAELTDGVALEPRIIDEFVDTVRCLRFSRRLLALQYISTCKTTERTPAGRISAHRPNIFIY